MPNIRLGSKIRINEVVRPVSREIAKVNSELKDVLDSAGLLSEEGVLTPAARSHERELRYAMLLLPSKMIGKAGDDRELIRLCTAAELAYEGISLHRDMYCPETEEGEPSGAGMGMKNDSRVLTGDMLHTLALLMLADIFSKEFLLDITRGIEKACHAMIADGIGREKTVNIPEKTYIESLKSRTAELAGTFSWLGAYISKANVEEAAVLEKCGYNLGMAYQILYDREHGNNVFGDSDAAAWVKGFTDEAQKAILMFKNNVYRKNVIRLIDYFQNYPLKEGGVGA